MMRAKAKPRTDREKLQDELSHLLIACPAESFNPPDCPLCEVRKLGEVERRHWFNDLSDEDLTYLATYHKVCQGIKLQRKRAMPRRNQKTT